MQTLSEEEKTEYQHKTLIERFDGDKTKVPVKEKNTKIKEAKIPTHMTTLEMIKEKLSIESIAAKRGLTIGTVIKHLEKLKGLKQINDALMANVKDTISSTDFDVIFAELKKSGDGKLQAIYDKFAGKYSYSFIQIVRLFT